jgi:hypothetical protein
MLAALERQARDVTRSAEELREEIVRGGESGRMLPSEGSKWADHPAFLDRYHSAHVWTLVTLARGGVASNEYMAVIERTTGDGKPYRKVVLLDVLWCEYVPVKGKRGAK